MSSEDGGDIPESLGNEFSQALQRRNIARQPDGSTLHQMQVPTDRDVMDYRPPSEYLVLEANHFDDATPIMEKAIRAGYTIVREDDMEGTGPVSHLKVLPFSHENGQGILRRRGQEAYQRWLGETDEAKKVDAACRARNAKLLAEQNAKAPERLKRPPQTEVIVKEPGRLPVTYNLSPRPSLMTRIKIRLTVAYLKFAARFGRKAS